MNYYLDTEFLEGPQNKKTFGINYKTPPTIDLISIGIVSDDDREYYAISKDFNLSEAWGRFQIEQYSGDMRNKFPKGNKVYWIRENVLKKVFNDLLKIEISEYHSYEDEFAEAPSSDFTYRRLKELISRYGKTNKEIAAEIITFCNPKSLKARLCGIEVIEPVDFPVFYAYYADYDWVVFCWLFGSMMNLPKGFPMYCRDLKQIIDEKASSFTDKWIDENQEFDARLIYIKRMPGYPKQDQSKAHSAIDDARWNKLFHEFLTSF